MRVDGLPVRHKHNKRLPDAICFSGKEILVIPRVPKTWWLCSTSTLLVRKSLVYITQQQPIWPAIKLLSDLSAQFKVTNNGDLCLAWKLMKKRGRKSRDTFNNAWGKLLNVELILISCHGDRKRPHPYALTFFAIDECKVKLDVKATNRPPSTWRQHEPTLPLKNRFSPTPSQVK